MTRLSKPSAKVLIVDDVSANLRMIEYMLAEYEMKVDSCTSGAEALKMAANEDYDLILMDHVMPGMDGIETVAILRSCGARMPVIALSANSMDNAKETFLRNDFNDFLSKPIRKDELANMLKTWLPACKLIKKQGVASAKHGNGLNNTLFKRLCALPGLDPREAVDRIGGDVDAYERTMKLTAATLPNNIEALNRLSGAAYALEAHGIRGALYNVGANKLGRMAEQLEAYARGDSAHKHEDIQLSELHAAFVGEARELFKNINGIFADEQDTKPKRQGSLRALKSALSGLDAAAADFDYKMARKIFEEINDLEFGKETDRILAEVKTAFERFDFETAVKLTGRLTKMNWEAPGDSFLDEQKDKRSSAWGDDG